MKAHNNHNNINSFTKRIVPFEVTEQWLLLNDGWMPSWVQCSDSEPGDTMCDQEIGMRLFNYWLRVVTTFWMIRMTWILGLIHSCHCNWKRKWIRSMWSSESFRIFRRFFLDVACVLWENCAGLMQVVLLPMALRNCLNMNRNWMWESPALIFWWKENSIQSRKSQRFFIYVFPNKFINSFHSKKIKSKLLSTLALTRPIIEEVKWMCAVSVCLSSIPSAAHTLHHTRHSHTVSH